MQLFANKTVKCQTVREEECIDIKFVCMYNLFNFHIDTHVFLYSFSFSTFKLPIQQHTTQFLFIKFNGVAVVIL